MKYILDFDEVLFNTAALKEKMAECNIPESERGVGVFDRIAEADPSFNIRDLVFPNVWNFLKKYEDDCIIVSSASSMKAENNTNVQAQEAFQEKKIELSGVGEFGAVVYVVGADKTEALAEIQQSYSDTELVFLDDREVYVRQARDLGIKSIWMDREGKGHGTSAEGVPTMLEFPRVGNFSEFVTYIEQCEKTQE